MNPLKLPRNNLMYQSINFSFIDWPVNWIAWPKQKTFASLVQVHKLFPVSKCLRGIND